ncbi:MAG TPA: FeoB-associated Cys-rich membrane protein [Longimicrobiales bacterium]|nr:FeoB-associated Cys-rich membrane protein [Longimicrobiales bacterium]
MITVMAILGFAVLFALVALLPLRRAEDCGGNCGACRGGECHLERRSADP